MVDKRILHFRRAQRKSVLCSQSAQNNINGQPGMRCERGSCLITHECIFEVTAGSFVHQSWAKRWAYHAVFISASASNEYLQTDAATNEKVLRRLRMQRVGASNEYALTQMQAACSIHLICMPVLLDLSLDLNTFPTVCLYILQAQK